MDRRSCLRFVFPGFDRTSIPWDHSSSYTGWGKVPAPRGVGGSIFMLFLLVHFFRREFSRGNAGHFSFRPPRLRAPQTTSPAEFNSYTR